MASGRVIRKLAAIVAVDVVGFSRLMQLDEAGTLARLKALRRAVVDPCVARHRGRIVKIVGDGALMDFSSAVDAVQCAAEIQSEFAARNADTGEREGIELRIGVNLGDVIIEGADIYGDGVNVAARLESVAEPGSVCISAAVHEQVRNRTPLRFRFVGARRLKNIETAVQVWTWRPPRAETPALPDGDGDGPELAGGAATVPAPSAPEPPAPSSPVLERDELIATLCSLLTEAEGGRGRIAAIVGEAGAGKTTLTQAFVRACADRCRRLVGACDDLSVPEPLAPLRDLTAAVGWSLSDAVDRGDRHLALFEQALAIFEGEPSLLVIEDLHWADDGTVDFVRYVGRRIRSKRILLIVTSRTEEAQGGEKLRRALGDVPPDDVVRLDVPALSESAVRRIADGAGLDGAALYESTGGNAFFVSELVRSGRLESPPSTVRDAVLARADRLGKGARAVADFAAIFPRHVEEELLEAFDHLDTDAGLDECLRMGLLVERDGAFAFRHEIARRALESALTATQRRRFNRRALELLQAGGEAPVGRLLHHAQEARATEAVIALAPQAAREACRMGAHREAAEHFETALRFVDRYPENERVTLYEDASVELHIVGKQERAIEVREAAAALHRAHGNRLGLGSSLRALSQYLYSAGQIDKARRYADEAVEVLEGKPTAGLAMAYSKRSQIAMLAYDVETAVGLGRKAVALAEELHRPDIVCHALNNIGHAMSWSDPAEGRRHLDRSLELALELRLPIDATRAFVNISSFELLRFELDGARRTLERGVSYAQEHQVDYITTYLLGYLARVHLISGEWDKAHVCANLSVQHPGATGTARFGGLPPLVQYGQRTGRFETGALLEELRGMLDHGRQILRTQAYASLVAEAAWLGRHDRDEALALLSGIIETAPNLLMVQDLLAWRRMLSPEPPGIDTSGLVKPYRLLFADDWRGAAQEWARIGAPYNQALALLEGDGEAVRSAIAILERLGAQRVVALAKRTRCTA